MTQHSESRELSLCLRYSKNSSRKAIHNKVLPRSEELERILVWDFCWRFCLLPPWITDYFLRSNILLKISTKDFLRSNPPKKSISQNCQLSTVTLVTQKNRFWKLLYCYIVTPGVNWRCPRKQEQSSRNLFFLSENCNTVSCKNYKSWCQWPVPVTSKKNPRSIQKSRKDYS